MWPWAAHEARIREHFPEIDDAGCAEMLHELVCVKEQDPLTALQDNIFEARQMQLMQMTPNFEMTMYLAQATGAFIVTDSALRWQEILLAARPHLGALPPRLRRLATKLADAEFLFPDDPGRVGLVAPVGTLRCSPRLATEMV